MIALIKLNVKKVHIVVPNQMLKCREIEDFSDYWELAQAEERVEYHTSLNFTHEQGHLILIDEADMMLLRDPKSSAEMLSRSNVVGFSSSLNNTRYKEMEENVLKDLHFTSYSFNPNLVQVSATTSFDRTIDIEAGEPLVQFISAELM